MKVEFMSFKDYLAEVSSAIDSVDMNKVDQILELLISVTLGGKKILVVGNGGSAAIASHFVTDLTRCSLNGRQKMRALSLVDNIPVLTATSNDLGYEKIFEYQIERIADQGDVLVAISSSGNSENILNGIRIAQKMGVKTISLSGFDGGLASKEADLGLVFRTANGNYGPTEDAHAIFCHFLARMLK